MNIQGPPRHEPAADVLRDGDLFLGIQRNLCPDHKGLRSDLRIPLGQPDGDRACCAPEHHGKFRTGVDFPHCEGIWPRTFLHHDDDPADDLRGHERARLRPQPQPNGDPLVARFILA